MRQPAWPWAAAFAEDPRSWVLESGEPAARWLLLTGVLDRAPDDAEVVAARAEVVVDAGTRVLIGRLPDWEAGEAFSGHDSPRFAPNLLNLLADMGVRAGDDPHVDHLLAQLLAHQDDEGRFQSYAPLRGGEAPAWGALLCDSHAILEVLVRYGHGADPRVRAGLDRMAADLADTAQGRAWPCRRDPATGFRGPGRAADCCPQVTLEALRTYALLPEPDRPPGLLDIARVSLGVWRHRGEHKPYVFGHGRQFKTVKWPPTWYRVDAVLDALGRYPALWRGPDAVPGDRRALGELAACLVRYNFGADGRVAPASTYRGFEDFSFGQKKRPSAFATARLLAVLHRLDELAPEALAIDGGWPPWPRVAQPNAEWRLNLGCGSAPGGTAIRRKKSGVAAPVSRGGPRTPRRPGTPARPGPAGCRAGSPRTRRPPGCSRRARRSGRGRRRRCRRPPPRPTRCGPPCWCRTSQPPDLNGAPRVRPILAPALGEPAGPYGTCAGRGGPRVRSPGRAASSPVSPWPQSDHMVFAMAGRPAIALTTSGRSPR